MTTLKDALGPMSAPLARVVACWRHAPPTTRRVITRAFPDLAEALDQLDKALEVMIGPL
jgi:hypothetical protein